VVVTTLDTREFTVDDLDGMPNDGKRYELIDGTLIVSPAPRIGHQRTLARLYSILVAVETEQREVLFAPVDWRVSIRTQLQPDLLVMPRLAHDARRLEQTPSLVVEVLSPSTRRLDLGTRRLAYEEAGVPAYWVFDPDGPALTVFRLGPAGRFDEPIEVHGTDRYVDPTFGVEVVPADVA
jgi:Uma2 family endonuclease